MINLTIDFTAKISIHEKSLQHNNSYLLVIRIPKSAFFSNALSFAKM